MQCWQMSSKKAAFMTQLGMILIVIGASNAAFLCPELRFDTLIWRIYFVTAPAVLPYAELWQQESCNNLTE